MAKHVLELNTLCYQILGVLIRQPRSGYDIVKELEIVRPVKTSQIYPTLARLEKQGLVVSENVFQERRPNKRTYHVTAQGKDKLTQWVGEEPDPPVLRDDFLTKVYSAWTREPAEVMQMFERRLEYLHDVMKRMETFLAKLHAEHPDKLKDPRDWRFYRNVLLTRRLMSCQQDAIWARSVIERLRHVGAAGKIGPGGDHSYIAPDDTGNGSGPSQNATRTPAATGSAG